MRIALCAIGMSVSLAGCTPIQSFYANDVVAATAVSRAVTAQKIDAKNGVFGLYKVDGRNYALVMQAYQGADILTEVNGALILGEKEAETLRETCRQIISAYGKTDGDALKVIEYHLVEKAVEMQAYTTAYAYQGVATATTQSGLYQNIPFRLQYTYRPGSPKDSSERISYAVAGGMSADMTIEQLKAFLEDLQK